MPEAPETEHRPPPFGSEGRRVVGVVAAVVAPATLITALAYYFGYRREEAFAGYFGIDLSALGFTSTDYVLRSVDALFVPITVLLLVAFGIFFLHALAGDSLDRVDVTPIAAAAGLFALVVGILLLAGHALSNEYGYLQALGPAVGVSLLVYALSRRRSVSRHALSAAAFIGVAVILVSVFWATSEYAGSRGHAEAKRLAHDIEIAPSVTVFSKEDLDINPLAPGTGAGRKCAALSVKKLRTGAFPFRYSGFTLLIRSGDRYFLTPTPVHPGDPWDPTLDSVFVIPDDGSVRIQLTRGVDYNLTPAEKTAQGHLSFAC